MDLAAGVRLGPYEILSPLGSGGMGDVYRARDSRLGRVVAIKILPDSFAGDPERRARFEREARAISSLAHPHVCTLYDVGREGAVDFLVMEYLEGESLDARLKRGPIPLDEALQYAIQIAGALHEAHRLGVVHRDLKPGNVMITHSGARLLDFGLARLRPVDALSSATTTETQTVLTAHHTLVGTVPYMAPEQLLGREADARSDIFSFGIVLFELVSGQRPFGGDTSASVMAGILEKGAPSLAMHAPAIPPALERIVQHCLAKEPERRWQNARDLELELTWIREGVSIVAEAPAAFPRRRRTAAFVGTVLFAAGAIGGAVAGKRLQQPAAEAERRVQFTVPLGAGDVIHQHNSSSIALSADGARIAYAVTRADARGLYVRSLDAPAPAWVAGGERAASPFFSPDGQWIAFESGGTLKKVQLDGGTPVPLCETPYFAGGAWLDNDTIFLVPSFTGGLFRLNARGGRLERVTTPDRQQGESAHLWPQALPDGRVLFTIWTGGNFDEARLAVLDPRTGKYNVVFEHGFHGRYSTGKLVFGRGNRLLAVPFDLARGAINGPVDPLVEGVEGDGGAGVAIFSVDRRGAVAYVPGMQRPLNRSLVAVRSDGKVDVTLASKRAFNAVRIAPDAQRLLFWIEEGDTGVWVKHRARDPLTRLTFSGDDHGSVWSPDGRRIAFESGRASTHHIFVRASDGSGEDRQITTGEHHHYLNEWSPDGRSLVYVEFHPETGADLWIVNVDGTQSPRTFRATRFSEKHAAFSPNGRWLAYVSNESDRNEVYVQAASGSGERTQISAAGGEEPAWSHAGDRLYYRTGSRMMTVSVDSSRGTFTAGQPAVLFEGLYHYTLLPSRTYDIGPDGRFYMVTLPDSARAPRQVNVMLNRLR